ncbi:hypothetical protein GG344DRAFT_90410 [Lentinula edodes]|nr:hypothetical protein GG344DRAFT_90410 [Lentinula edodes]
MPNRRIPPEVKHCAINLYDRGVLDLSEILDCVGFSERTFYRVLACWRETGDVIPHKYGLTTGRPRAMLYDDIDYLLCLVRHKPNYFLDELLLLFEENCFISVHYSTIMRELSRYQLGFIDETSKDDRTPGRRQGRAKKGQRASTKQPFVRGKRLTATGLLTQDGMMASRVVEGSMTCEMFCSYLEEEVVIALVCTISRYFECSCYG